MASVTCTTEKGFLSSQLAPFQAILQFVGHSRYLTRGRCSGQAVTDNPEKPKLTCSLIIQRYFVPVLYDIWTLSFVVTFVLISAYRIYCVSAAGIAGDLSAAKIITFSALILRYSSFCIGVLFYIWLYTRYTNLIKILDSFVDEYCGKKDKVVMVICLIFVVTSVLSRYLFRTWIGITGNPFSQSNVDELLRTSGLSRCQFVYAQHFGKHFNAWLTVIDNLAFLSGCLTMIITTMICLTIGIVFRNIAQQLDGKPDFARSAVIRADVFWQTLNKHLQLCEEVLKLDALLCWITMVYYCLNLMSALNFIGAVKQSTADQLTCFELGEMLFSASLMTFRSVFVQEQAEVFLPVLRKGYEHAADKQQRSLIKFHIGQLQAGRVGFTVAGVFSINRRFVVTLIGGFVTYAFVILELGDKNLSKSDTDVIRNIIHQELLNASSAVSNIFYNSTAR